MSDLRGRIRSPAETQRLRGRCLELFKTGLNRTIIGERLGLDRKSVGRLISEAQAAESSKNVVHAGND